MYFCRQLENADHDFIASKIISLFRNECKETYYVPPIRKKDSSVNKSILAKGKLIDMYRNDKTFIRSCTNGADALGVSIDLTIETSDGKH